jgi:hypothetical protein
VQAGAMKIYVAAVEALRKKESHDETEFTSKIGGKTSLGSQIFCFIKFSFPVTRLLPYHAETNRSRSLIVGLYEISIVESFRGKKRTRKACFVCLCNEVNDYRRSYLQNCKAGKLLTPKCAWHLCNACIQASNLGPRSFDHYSFALQNQPIGFKHLYTHTCTSTQKYLVQTSAKIKQWMMRDSSKAE